MLARHAAARAGVFSVWQHVKTVAARRVDRTHSFHQEHLLNWFRAKGETSTGVVGDFNNKSEQLPVMPRFSDISRYRNCPSQHIWTTAGTTHSAVFVASNQVQALRPETRELRR